jgi:hypothetical protein
MQPVLYKYTSTKEYHDAFPCAYRQWRADSHCNLIHGYSFSMKFYFGTDSLDVRNWAADYGGLKELKSRVFGNKPAIPANTKANIEIYQENGKALYNKIEEKTGRKFNKNGAVIKKDKDQNIQFIFPQISTDNIKLVEDYYEQEKDNDEISKEVNIEPIKVNTTTERNEYIKFPLDNKTNVLKILKKAGLEPKKDYKLSVEPISENFLRGMVKEIITRKNITK